MARLDGKVAIVTGTTSGIGRATLELFAQEGARVVGSGRRADLGEEVVAAVRAEGGDARFVPADVSRREDVRSLVSRTLEWYGGIDVVVNNAAVGVFAKTVENTEEDEWDRVLAINLKSVYLVSHEAIPHIRARGGGSIVNVASVHSMATMEGVAAYAAAKGGVLALTRQMALDLARDRIRVNALVVGAVDTDMLRSQAEREGKSYAELGWSTSDRDIARIGRPEEVARAALFLAGDESTFVTGAPLIVDGGLLARL